MVSVPHGSASLPLQFFPKIVCINMSCNRIGSYQIYLYVLVSYKFDASMFAIDCSKQTMFFFYRRALSVKWGRFHLSRNVTGERSIKHIRCS